MSVSAAPGGWSRQWTMFFITSCESEAVRAQGAGPSQPGHVQQHGRRHFWTPPPDSNALVLMEPSPCAGTAHLYRNIRHQSTGLDLRISPSCHSEASTSIWTCRTPDPPSRAPPLWAGCRGESHEGGAAKHGRVWGLWGWWVWGVWGDMSCGQCLLLMSRRNSGPLWSAPRPQCPGRPWSWCPGTRV